VSAKIAAAAAVARRVQLAALGVNRAAQLSTFAFRSANDKMQLIRSVCNDSPIDT